MKYLFTEQVVERNDYLDIEIVTTYKVKTKVRKPYNPNAKAAKKAAIARNRARKAKMAYLSRV